jgi:murein L,D-transpeptidase YcbB/YkuD
MNIPVAERIRQIMINMERLRWFNAPDSSMDFLVVNIPAYKLLVFEKGTLSWDMNVVVGTTANRTTIFKGMLSQIVFNPYWNVPESILWNEMLTNLQSNAAGYTQSQNLEVLRGGRIIEPNSIDWNDPEEVSSVRIRQRPGDQNSLGRIKFLFPNSFSIYLHDTPAKHLFNKNDRSFSHGCIRLEDARKLAGYLLEKDRSGDDIKIDNLLSGKKEISVRLKRPLPVFIVYFTSWVDENLKLHFRHDVYNNDKLLEKEMFDYPIL